MVPGLPDRWLFSSLLTSGASSVQDQKACANCALMMSSIVSGSAGCFLPIFPVGSHPEASKSDLNCIDKTLWRVAQRDAADHYRPGRQFVLANASLGLAKISNTLASARNEHQWYTHHRQRPLSLASRPEIRRVGHVRPPLSGVTFVAGARRDGLLEKYGECFGDRDA